MITALLCASLLVHGLIHLAIWLPQDAAEQLPFDPGRSWVLTAAAPPRSEAVELAAVGFASATALLYAVAGTSAATQSDGWPIPAATGAVMGLILKALWFSPWLTAGLLLDTGVITSVLTSLPRPLY
ncbi:hypothetical protein [Streptomyces adonidis]|uniref:ABC transporter permease n=1 Tax=Streptomyces sp. NBC_00093 TaxID=2975649 RepID=A0AAU2AFN5_9ACTN